MANYDLTSRIAPHLDRHLVFPLLEFLQERQLYDDDEILKAKIELLSQTNMVDYAMDIHKSLYHTDDVPQGPFSLSYYCYYYYALQSISVPLVVVVVVGVFGGVCDADLGFVFGQDDREEGGVVARLKSLEESAAPLISFLQSATLVQELRADKQYNIQMLHDRFQVVLLFNSL
ncbi:Eukaryotic translation initiation factor 3 subunit E [Ananas comosus]|uniref:Eukaryotic translation initiation factor 3 subunit E n=1 Tax=Ananas comosus TaxID=4615 RepID=A0A199UQA3_ANACO|nr:Eukaryotic translation initiation factor 3 subunit E [Ananas comosus]